MRDRLWTGSPDDHIREIDAFFATPEDGVIFVVKRFQPSQRRRELYHVTCAVYCRLVRLRSDLAQAAKA
ncbi:hypothetical protein C2W62_45855 [Candidatus Entotheonella serta]|nr:hypothetical protein C2W62_45855 [Candidatus Entotheonella serta]